MRVFLDFEASSLGRHGVPIEVAWVFEDGRAERHLIRPAPGWTDWDPAAEAIHRIPATMLHGEGEPHDTVARRMVEVLAGHDLFASAPSWDGKWLSALLRAAGLPRHALRLRDTEEAQAEAARAALAGAVAAAGLEAAVAAVLADVAARGRGVPAHRALADARAELALWHGVRAAASAAARLARVNEGAEGALDEPATGAAGAVDDHFNLQRFVEAQQGIYATALGEIRAGEKRSHWMWFVFPQVAGLGRSGTARHYAIRSLAEARAYLDHPVLGPRLRESVDAVLALHATDADAVFGHVDALKLRSSLTLFAEASAEPRFAEALRHWYGGRRDDATHQLLEP